MLALGASAGLIPCPSALVVLLGAVSQHQIGLGLVLIVAFSAGPRGDAHRAGRRGRARLARVRPAAGARPARGLGLRGLGRADRDRRDRADRPGRAAAVIRMSRRCAKAGINPSPTLHALLNTVRAHRLRVSTTRRAVLEALVAAELPLTAEEIAGGRSTSARSTATWRRWSRSASSAPSASGTSRATSCRPHRRLGHLPGVRALDAAQRERADRHPGRDARGDRLRRVLRSLPDRRALPGLPPPSTPPPPPPPPSPPPLPLPPRAT